VDAGFQALYHAATDRHSHRWPGWWIDVYQVQYRPVIGIQLFSTPVPKASDGNDDT